MGNVTNHERAGVYSVYEASSVVSAKAAGAICGLAAVCAPVMGGAATLSFYHYEQAVSALGGAPAVLRLVELLLRNGASAVFLAPVAASDGDYAAAFAALAAREAVSILLCDSTLATVHAQLKAAVHAASDLRHECLAVVCGASGEDTTALLARAAELNSERMVLLAPEATEELLKGPCLAAALAGAMAGESDPALPIGGAVLRGLADVSQVYSEENIDALVRGGVTIVERVAGEISVVRAVTTRTKTGGVVDSTWRELSTIRIVDDVIPAVRAALRARFARAKNTEQQRAAIRSQVVLELENKLRREIITGYGAVQVRALEDRPTVCLVEFSFTVTHGLNQIWLSAKITV